MESTNFPHHHQQEDQQLLMDSSCYELSWYQNPILNGTINNTNSRDVKQQANYNIDFAQKSQDLGLQLSTMCTVNSIESFTVHDLQHLARIKNESSVTRSYSELPAEIINSSPTSSIKDYTSKNDHQHIRYHNDNNQDMLFKTFSNGSQIHNNHHLSLIPSAEKTISYSYDANTCYRDTFSHIFPTLHTSNLDLASNAFDINLPTLDPFISSTINGYFKNHHSSQIVQNLDGLVKDNYLSYGVHQMHRKTAAFETTESKRPAGNYVDAQTNKATPTKKSKLELRPSCTPLKIRKEKLGDRISALQQMVAPFGKTDTASVLMEAIGYIKFLQSQVETLSVPYMKSTQKADRVLTPGSIKDGNEDAKRDLRSRGLCLVPISCLSYVTYGSGSIWTSP